MTCEVTAVKLETLRSILLPLLLPFFLRIPVISGCHNSTSEHSQTEQLTNDNTPCVAFRRQKCQADFFAQSLMFFPHSLTHSKGEQISWVAPVQLHSSWIFFKLQIVYLAGSYKPSKPFGSSSINKMYIHIYRKGFSHICVPQQVSMSSITFAKSGTQKNDPVFLRLLEMGIL